MVTHASSVAVVTASSVLVILTKLLLRLLGSGVGQPQVGLVGLGAAHNRGHGLGFALEQTISVFRRNCSLLPVEIKTNVKQTKVRNHGFVILVEGTYLLAPSHLRHY